MSGLPDFLTVEETARILRIGRTAAYELSRRYEETDGAEGIPVIRVGRLMRVPRRALERWNGGPLTDPETNDSSPSPQPTRRRQRKPRLSQEELPLND